LVTLEVLIEGRERDLCSRVRSHYHGGSTAPVLIVIETVEDG
jgi:hypothetical protein